MGRGNSREGWVAPLREARHGERLAPRPVGARPSFTYTGAGVPCGPRPLVIVIIYLFLLAGARGAPCPRALCAAPRGTPDAARGGS